MTAEELLEKLRAILEVHEIKSVKSRRKADGRLVPGIGIRIKGKTLIVEGE